MKNYRAKKDKSRLPLLLAGLFFLIWGSAVVFALGETFSRTHETGDVSAAAFPDDVAGSPARSPILDRNLSELAVSFPTKSVYARPLEVVDPAAAASFLARVLGVDEKGLLRHLREERGYFWVGRQLPEEVGERVREAHLKGVYVVDESQRYYPQGSVAAHVVGFVGDGHGLAGIEAKYDRQLRGVASPLERQTAAAVHGPLVLTMDLRVQELLERQVARLMKATSAKSGCGLVLETGSGGILALASNPAYDPNFFWEYDEKGRLNRVVAPGLPASGFQNLFRLAAFYQGEALAAQDGEGKQAKLDSLKSELKLNHLLETIGDNQDRLLKQDGVFLSPALAKLNDLEVAGDFAGFCRKLDLMQPTADGDDVPNGRPDDLFRPTAKTLLGGLAALLNPAGTRVPHLLAGVLDEATGKLHPDDLPVESVVNQATAEKMQTYFRRLPNEGGGVKILEELSPSPDDEVQAATPQSPDFDAVRSDKAESKDEEVPHFSTMLIAVAGGEKSPPLLMLLSLEGAEVDPVSKTPMAMVAEKILPRVKKLASASPSPKPWKPRQNLWRAEWHSMQMARVGKSPERVEVDRRQMPNLRGLSLRKALQALNRYDLKIRVQGAGQVTRQKPAPGETISGGQCLLVLAGLK